MARRDERPRLGWSDLPGARVGIWGLGREGGASLRKLRSLGVDPVLVDDRPAPGPDTVLATADSGLDALARCEIVIKTPGISRYGPEADHLRAAGSILVGGLGLWLYEALASGPSAARVVCVTGTKGKSTTSAILGHLLHGLGYRAMIGGNFGAAPYDPEHAGRYDYWVIEVSSYTATDLAVTPPVTAVTSLHPDHLPWHGTLERYYRDKLSATAQPGAGLTVANGDSDLLRERVGLLGPKVEWVGAADDPGAAWMDPLGLPGPHNRRNALIARRVLAAVGIAAADDRLLRATADDGALARAAAGFTPLPSRLTTVGAVDGVAFIDDSLSTNVLPTLAALDAFPGRRIALIVGGQDRGIDYAPLAAGLLARPAPTLVLTLPDSGPRISATISAATATGTTATVPGRDPGDRSDPGDRIDPGDRSDRGGRDGLSDRGGRDGLSDLRGLSGSNGLGGRNGLGVFAGVVDCPDLDAAVTQALAWARPDGIVLLSPAAPSFGRFRDYRDRGDHFAAAMRRHISGS